MSNVGPGPCGRPMPAVPVHLVLALACLALSPGHAAPITADDGPDALAYGQDRGYPVPVPGMRPEELGQAFYVGLHSHYDRFRPLQEVPNGPKVSALDDADVGADMRYDFAGQQFTIDDYLRRRPVTGLLIAQDSSILLERYQYGRTPQTRFLSHSMAKTITGLLVGAALDEGAIRSIDDPASAYVPELAGTAYGQTPIRDLLLMASGVAFRETYRPGDDVSKLVASITGPGAAGAIEALRAFDHRVAEPGTAFNYASADTQVLGLVVSRATGMPLSGYLSRRLWQPLGAEAPAAWDADAAGDVLSFCCMVARLRDWARLGLMLAHDGEWNGRQVVSRGWIAESTTPQRGLSRSYGYQIWLPGGKRRFYMMRGVLGQYVLIDPLSRLVLVQTAVNLKPVDSTAESELLALWHALVRELGQPGDWRRR